MRRVEIEPSPLKNTFYLRLICDCGGYYFGVEGGGIAAQHHVNIKEKYEEIYTCNTCDRYYKLSANRGLIEISHTSKRLKSLRYIPLTFQDVLSISRNRKKAKVLMKQEIDGKIQSVIKELRKHPTRSYTWHDSGGQEFILYPGLSVI